MNKGYTGKILICVGIALIIIPLFTAIIYEISLFFRVGKLANFIGQNLLYSTGGSNVILKWIGNLINVPRINNIQYFFQHHFLQNVSCLLLPNLFIIFGFYFLLKQNQNISISKCFNKTVIIGLAVNILVLFYFLGLYTIIYNHFQMSFRSSRWLSFIPRNILFTSIGIFIYNFSLFFVSTLLHLILVIPTFVILAGYTEYFKKQNIENIQIINNNLINNKSFSYEEEQNETEENEMARKKINRMERVALSGGIIGALATNPRSAIEKKIMLLNADGWNCHQIIPHSGRNILVKILQAIILVSTLFLWTFGDGYLLLFEKEIE